MAALDIVFDLSGLLHSEFIYVPHVREMYEWKETRKCKRDRNLPVEANNTSVP